MEFFKNKPPSKFHETEPIVKARPEKAQGMGRTVIIPKTVEISNKLPEDQERKRSKKDGPAEIFYEGYVDDKKQLVPDSNLEAMKDTINFKMRIKTSVRFKNESRYDHIVYDHLHRRLASLLDKVRSPVTSLVDPELKTQLMNNYQREDETHSREPVLRVDSGQGSKEETVSVEGDSSVQVHDSQTSVFTEPRSPSSGSTDCGEYRSRFLISGHLGSDNKPVYIIQEYEGQGSVFKDQPINFKSSTEEGNVSVSISAKLFKDNILTEQDGNPQSLNLAPNKILIDPDKSKIYWDVFEETINIKGVDVLLKGKFLENKSERQFTPLLSIKVERHREESHKVSSKMTEISKRKTSSKIFLYKPLTSKDDSLDVLVRYEKKLSGYASKSRSLAELKELKYNAEDTSTSFVDKKKEAVETNKKTPELAQLEKDKPSNKNEKKPKEKLSTDVEKLFKQVSFLRGIFKNSA